MRHCKQFDFVSIDEILVKSSDNLLPLEVKKGRSKTWDFFSNSKRDICDFNTQYWKNETHIIEFKYNLKWFVVIVILLRGDDLL